MKAVGFTSTADRRSSGSRTRRIPCRAPGRAIVRVRACALNHLDLWERRGLDRVKLPLPHISGSDVAGEIVDPGGVGAAGRQRVMLQPGLRCGACAACAEGRDNQCVQYDVLGLRSDGGYAELISVPAENLIAIPAAPRLRHAPRRFR